MDSIDEKNRAFELFEEWWDEFYHKENNNMDWHTVAQFAFFTGCEFGAKMTKTNHNILYKLIDSCLQHNLRFGSFYAYMGRYVVTAHDAKLAGRKPELNEMRDNTDYMMAMDSWKKRGIRILAIDDSPYGAIDLALDYLDKLDK